MSAFELFVAAAFWGFGFVAVIWSLQTFDAFEVTFLRFFIGTLVGLPWVIWFASRHSLFDLLKLSFLPAMFLVMTLIFQSWGLHYTTATKSGFITTLYVVLVPALESMLKRRGPPLVLWICVLMALVGTILLVNIGVTALNVGDVLTLVCAFSAAGQIYILGLISPKVKNPFIFNQTQSLWALFICLPFAFHDHLFTKFNMAIGVAPVTVWLGLLALSVGSTVFAFFLQVRAQAHLSPTLSSLLCLLESPFALLFAIYFLNEALGPREALGALLIFSSGVLATLWETKRLA